MRRLALIVCVLVACQQSERDGAETLVRFGTHWGIGKPTANNPGTVVAHLLDLFAEPAQGRLDVAEQTSEVIRLRARGGDAAALMPHLAHPQLRQVRLDGGDILAEFDGPPPPLSDVFLDEMGPFETTAFTPDVSLMLRRRLSSANKVNIIEVTNYPSEEEVWRRFLGNEVDIIGLGSEFHARRLQTLPSVRFAKIPRPPTIALRLNMRARAVASLEVRRALSLALHRRDIAQAATGLPDSAYSTEEDANAARVVLSNLGLKLRILYPRGETNPMQALLVLDRQLSNVGVRCEFVPFEANDAARVLKSDDHDAWVFFGALDSRYFYLFGGESPGNFDGYQSPAFDAALEENDVDRATAILRSDLPLLPLYDVPQTFAYHSRFCNVRPIKTSDLTWLADVRLCAPGERD